MFRGYPRQPVAVLTPFGVEVYPNVNPDVVRRRGAGFGEDGNVEDFWRSTHNGHQGPVTTRDVAY
jgi:hypothetical protein